MKHIIERWFPQKKADEKTNGTEPEVETTEKCPEPPDLDQKDVVWLRRMLSHNIRMPMAIISGYGEMLKAGSFSSREEELACISKICKNIDFLDTFLKVILDDDTTEEPLEEKEWFDLLKCVKETADYVKNLTQKANISVSVNSSKQEILLFGNKIILMRAFYNLIENSVRYMNRAGSIYITVEETPEEVILVYRDDGEGMDLKEGEDITKLNYQGENRKPSGHGIGMYLVRSAVEKNGGTIQIKSSKGKGMSVYMTFAKTLITF